MTEVLNSRRTFLKTAALGGAAMIGAGSGSTQEDCGINIRFRDRWCRLRRFGLRHSCSSERPEADFD